MDPGKTYMLAPLTATASYIHSKARHTTRVLSPINQVLKEFSLTGASRIGYSAAQHFRNTISAHDVPQYSILSDLQRYNKCLRIGKHVFDQHSGVSSYRTKPITPRPILPARPPVEVYMSFPVAWNDVCFLINHTWGADLGMVFKSFIVFFCKMRSF